MPHAVKKANQPFRIALLRLFAVLLIPILLMVDPAYSDDTLLNEALEPLGSLMVIAGVLGRFWSILYIGGRKNDMVMMIGPYSMCRHPLYFFSTMATIGLGLLLGSVVLAAFLGGAVYLILMNTAKDEERFLRSEFGPVYDGYAKRTPLILPRPSLFHTPNEVEFSVRHLRVNMRDALVFLAFIPLAESIDYIREIVSLPTISLY